jgi:hypothetical protein
MVLRLFTGPKGETRVNLKHLLEDIRDSYSLPLSETIIVEIIANALDSRTGEIRLLTDPGNNTLTIIDDGKGMNQYEFQKYHDIAATTKIRGKGIGFAGIGAKLSLLVGKVTTETIMNRHHAASEWWLETEQRAPWKSISPKNRIASRTGTSVSIACPAENPLTDEKFVKETVLKHFYPLIDSEFGLILNDIYTRPIKIYVNGCQLTGEPVFSERRMLIVKKGRRQKPIGFGFIVKADKDLDEDLRGMAISTYGKIIKRGWDWIGETPRNPGKITGIVEIPELAAILTTNKSDFLRDAASLAKFYAFRKSVQDTLRPVLQEMGEIASNTERKEAAARPLEKEIRNVLRRMIEDFPELSPLLGRLPGGDKTGGVIPDAGAQPIGTLVEGSGYLTGTSGGDGEGGGITAAPGADPEPRIQPDPAAREKGIPHEGRQTLPTLTIKYDDLPHVPEIGWLRENIVWINKGHPAYKKTGPGGEKYYTHLVVAWVLAGQLEESKSPLDFINQYMLIWGKGHLDKLT